MTRAALRVTPIDTARPDRPAVSKRRASSAGYRRPRADRRVWRSRPTVAPPRRA